MKKAAREVLEALSDRSGFEVIDCLDDDLKNEIIDEIDAIIRKHSPQEESQ